MSAVFVFSKKYPTKGTTVHLTTSKHRSKQQQTKPQESLALQQPPKIDLTKMEDYSQLDVKTRASFETAAVRAISGMIRFAWVQLGFRAIWVHDLELWKEIGYDSFRAWAEDAAGKSDTQVYEAMRLVRELKLTYDQLLGVTQAAARLLQKVPESKRVAVAKEAKGKSTKEVEQHIQSNLPDLHIESTRKISMRLPESLCGLMIQAVDTAKVLEDSDSDEVAWEKIITTYLNASNDDNPQISNLEAAEGKKMGKELENIG